MTGSRASVRSFGTSVGRGSVLVLQLVVLQYIVVVLQLVVLVLVLQLVVLQ